MNNITIVRHNKTNFDAKNRKENIEDNVSRHKNHNKDKSKNKNDNVKKGYDKNAFIIQRQIKSLTDTLIKPNIEFVTLNYFNNQAILNSMRECQRDMDDLVSVIIPTFNRYESLRRAIKSVKNQTYKNIEVIVVNDASTQREYYEKSFGDVIVINLDVNMKTRYNVLSAQGLTRNEGIKVAKGKWIAFLDDDDYWVPEKIEIQLHYLKKHNMKICSTNYFRGYGLYSDDKMDYCKGLCGGSDILANIGKYENILIAPNYKYSLTSTVIIDRAFLDKVGHFKLIDAEDWDLWNRVYKMEKTLFIDILLVYYDLGHAGAKYYKVGNNWNGINITL
jgi:glycosyltransferase involved in cell wall biosynthesis